MMQTRSGEILDFDSTRGAAAEMGEETVRVAQKPKAAPRLVSSGLPSIDAVTGGGIPLGRTTLLCGAVGSGKTHFALRFLAAGLLRGERAVHLSLDQKPEHVLEDAAVGGIDVTASARTGGLTLLDGSACFTARRGRRPPEPQRLVADLTREIRRSGASRLVIDSLTSLVPASLGADERLDLLRTLLFALEDGAGCSTLLTCRHHEGIPGGSHVAAEAEALASAVLRLRLGGDRGGNRGNGPAGRFVSVRKLRGASSDPAGWSADIPA